MRFDCAGAQNVLRGMGLRGMGLRHFFCKFPHKMPLAGFGSGIFPFQSFPHKMALVTCPCAFPLRTLAQSVLPGFGISLPLLYYQRCALFCALICVLFYVCSPLCALLCVLSYVCSRMCAFICMLLSVCSHMCAFICALSDVCSPMCASS